MGIENAVGDFCAFIDSDAYPRRDWLSNAIRCFEDLQVAAIGGPGLTPTEDNVMQRASGCVLSSFMVGNLSSRYKARWSFESDDMHSCNFIVRKEVLKEAGGWNEKYWPGEDTLICLAIKKLGRKMVESSDVVVYHHRRPLFVPHLKQVSRFGSHRGFFAKRFAGNSFRSTYFLPSVLVLSLFVGVFASLLNRFFFNVFLLAVAVYLVLSLIAAALEGKEAKLLLPVWFGIIMTHAVYGLSFWAGLIKRDLRR
jgi:cellulose synthase/poly-beta-1,6-N-acetylglucosamine synthase-like glycosyltransferase